MRIADPENNQGLNDEGDKDIKTIENRVKKFRHSAKIVALASNDTRYLKMVKQIDRYWENLFAYPIEVETRIGKTTIQPWRTNNLMERSFRCLKQHGRKKNGQHNLSRTLKGMFADTPLVKNLSHPDYLAILLKGKQNLAKRFADIDIEHVRKEQHENDKNFVTILRA